MDNIIKSMAAHNSSISTPFGQKPLIYADYTASGRTSSLIEEALNNYVYPTYSNTHSDSSFCSIQTSHFREDARKIIKTATNCNEEDLVIFVGNGSTGAINLLVGLLEKGRGTVNESYCFKNRFGTYDCILCKIPFENRGLYEVHSHTKEHMDLIPKAKLNIPASEVCLFCAESEHNSSLLPWREVGYKVELIPLLKNGTLDLMALEE